MEVGWFPEPTSASVAPSSRVSVAGATCSPLAPLASARRPYVSGQTCAFHAGRAVQAAVSSIGTLAAT